MTVDEAGHVEHADTFANQVFGFWVFIMSDLLLFGALFAT